MDSTKAQLDKAWRDANPDKTRAYSAQQYERILASPELHAQKKAKDRRRHFARKYGMSLDEYDALVQSQNGRCLICDAEEKLYVDHDHKTGVVRGGLCNRCNLGIGYFSDSPDKLKRAAQYLTARLKIANSGAASVTH